jgi:hypothetical protein
LVIRPKIEAFPKVSMCRVSEAAETTNWAYRQLLSRYQSTGQDRAETEKVIGCEIWGTDKLSSIIIVSIVAPSLSDLKPP